MRLKNSTARSHIVDPGHASPQALQRQREQCVRYRRKHKENALRQHVAELQNHRRPINLVHTNRLWKAYYNSPYIHTLTHRNAVSSSQGTHDERRSSISDKLQGVCSPDEQRSWEEAKIRHYVNSKIGTLSAPLHRQRSYNAPGTTTEVMETFLNDSCRITESPASALFEKHWTDPAAHADLLLHVPWKTPQLPQGIPKEACRPDFRYAQDYWSTQILADGLSLFDDPTLDITEACPWRPSTPYDYWSQIKQQRYFWNFLNACTSADAPLQNGTFEKEVQTELLRRHISRVEQVQNEIRVSKQKIYQEEEQKRHFLTSTGKMVVVPFEFLPSIYAHDPPPQQHLVLRQRVVPVHRIYDFGIEVENLCTNPPLLLDVHRWAKGLLKQPYPLSARVAELMDYLRKKGELPAKSKSFDDTYPTLSKQILERLQKEREVKEARETEAKRRGVSIGELGMEAREVRKIAGGRYALR